MRLAAMGKLDVFVAVDGASLDASLRAIQIIREAKELEAYFIRYGASVEMMRSLFKVRRNVTLERRREYGVKRPSGRIPQLDRSLCARICRAWASLKETNLRLRYFQLHQAFQEFPIAVLAAVVAESEEGR